MRSLRSLMTSCWATATPTPSATAAMDARVNTERIIEPPSGINRRTKRPLPAWRQPIRHQHRSRGSIPRRDGRSAYTQAAAPGSAGSITYSLLFGRLGRCRTALAPPLPQSGDPARDHIKDRRRHQAERGDADHAEEHRRAERLAQFGTGADGPDQGRHAQNKGERGHQDRPQPKPRRLDGRIPAVAALVLELAGEFDDQ